MRRMVLLVPALLAAVAGCTYPQEAQPYQPPGIHEVGAPETGEQWYRRDCAWCHGARGEGTPRGPALTGGRNGEAFTDFMLRTGRMPIQDPNAPVRRNDPVYDDETIASIVDYVASLGGEGPVVPRPNPAAGDLALGQKLYQANCAACHSATGIGGTLTQGDGDRVSGEVARRSGVHAPGIGRSSAVEIVEAMVVGPGTMPVFSEETFSRHEIDSIVRYVLHLQRSGNPGGGSLGRVGPVAEGAVALIVGLGAMVVLARWIGKRVGGDG